MTGVERIIGTEFDDELYFGGGIQTNEPTLFGRGGDDELFAGAGGKAFGGAGDDVLTGGGAGLSLQGDAGADRFSTGLSQGGNNTFATINDFQRGTDELRLELGLGHGRSEFDFLDSNNDAVLNASDASVDHSFRFVDGQRSPALQISTSSEGEFEQEAIFDLGLAGVTQRRESDFFT